MVDVGTVSKNFVALVEELDVYKRAYAVSLEIHRTTRNFPKEEQYGFAEQIRRASKSICANLAEGFAKQSHSRAEFRRFISIAIGSAGEMQTWIRYSYDLGFIDYALYSKWKQEYLIISRMLQKLRNSKEDSNYQLPITNDRSSNG